MKTVRFSQLVKKGGKPAVHLQLVAPGKDRELQRAAKQHRVITVNQATVGHAADFGTVGLDLNLKGQILVFPRSLAKFSGRRVVGIKYDLLEQPPIPKEALARRARPKKKAKSKTKRASPRPSTLFRLDTEHDHERESALAERDAAPPKKAAASSAREPRRRKAPKEDKQAQRKAPSPKETQQRIKRALRALEAGQSVKAYNILKELVAD